MSANRLGKRTGATATAHLVKVEHNVELAHGTEVPVQRLHVRVDELKHDQRVFVAIHASQHKEGCVASVNHLSTSPRGSRRAQPRLLRAE